MKKYLYLLATDQKKGIIAAILQFVLLLVSFIFRIVAGTRNCLFDCNVLKTKHLEVPVICVGNITVGGVGKTPLVIHIAKYVQNLGKKPVILTRGYMDRASDFVNSDEYQLLKARLKNVDVLVGKDRYALAKTYLTNNTADVFIMDDGFQHRQLHRDLNIVAVNVQNPWGNRQLLPRGILREGISGLKRADVCILTKVDQKKENQSALRDFLKSKIVTKEIISSEHRVSYLIDLVSGQSKDIEQMISEDVCLLSSIGDPDAFTKTVQDLKMNVCHHFEHMDHYQYQENDINLIVKKIAELNTKYLVTTEKDAVKLKSFNGLFGDDIKILVVGIDINLVEGGDVLGERIHRLFIS